MEQQRTLRRPRATNESTPTAIAAHALRKFGKEKRSKFHVNAMLLDSEIGLQLLEEFAKAEELNPELSLGQIFLPDESIPEAIIKTLHRFNEVIQHKFEDRLPVTDYCLVWKILMDEEGINIFLALQDKVATFYSDFYSFYGPPIDSLLYASESPEQKFLFDIYVYMVRYLGFFSYIDHGDFIDIAEERDAMMQGASPEDRAAIKRRLQREEELHKKHTERFNAYNEIQAESILKSIMDQCNGVGKKYRNVIASLKTCVDNNRTFYDCIVMPDENTGMHPASYHQTIGFNLIENGIYERENDLYIESLGNEAAIEYPTIIVTVNKEKISKLEGTNEELLTLYGNYIKALESWKTEL